MKERQSWINRIMGTLLGNIEGSFQEIQIDHELLEEIMQIAKEAHPHEFMAMLQGKVHKDVLKVENLIFLPGETSNEGAVMKIFMMPMATGAVGSVHSHPIPNNTPSTADLQFFAKNGLIHLIIAYPYRESNIQAYNTFGEMVVFRVV
ncbi:MAG: Mov34/MPN/PAD-1 family protein [Methanobacteriaceae archaeon]